MTIYPGDFFDADLDYLSDKSFCKTIANLVYVFLEQLQSSEDAMWQLVKTKGEYQTPFFNCRPVTSLQKKGFNLYRIRPLGTKLSRFRLIYAYDNVNDDFYILAVTEKPTPNDRSQLLHDRIYNYEPNHEIKKRICIEYDSILKRYN